MLGIVLLLGLCVAAASWNTRRGRDGPAEQMGFDLRAEAPSPKVNSTSAEAPAVSPAPLPVPDQQVEPPQEREVPAVTFPAPVEPSPPRVVDVPVPSTVEVPPPLVEVKGPAMPPPPPMREPKAAPVMCFGPGSLADSCFRESHRGDSPMMRNWTTLKLSALMAVALAVTPAPAAGPTELGQDDLKPLKDSMDVLTKKLDAMNASLSKAFEGLEVDLKKIKNEIKAVREAGEAAQLTLETHKGALQTLETQVAKLRLDMDKLHGRKALYPQEQLSLDEIKSRLAQIETALAKMAEPRTSYSPPVNVGRIQLVNMYGEEMLFVINGKGYRVAPFATATLEGQPAGAFTYEVISGTYGLRARNSPLLEAGKTYTITVR
jgi:hypothetical protein